jgi:tRNA(adenine34) deaminase
MQVRAEYDQAMQRALVLAAQAQGMGEIPIGAVILDSSLQIVAEGFNLRETTKDPTAHAEVEAIRTAAQLLNSSRLDGHTLVVTLEPCAMCAGAAMNARLQRLVFGTDNKDYGAAGSMFDVVRDGRLPHKMEVIGGVRELECKQQLDDFFILKR